MTNTQARVSAAVVIAFSTWVGLRGLASQSRGELAAMVGKTTPGYVTSVVDGDTIHVRLHSGRGITVRLDGVDTPETGEPFSTQARNATRVLLFDQPVQLVGKDIDRYDRLVARVYVGAEWRNAGVGTAASGIDASLELVKSGLACHFLRYSSDPLLAAAEKDAKEHARGFWSPSAQKPQCVSENAALVAGSARTSSRAISPPTGQATGSAGGRAGRVVVDSKSSSSRGPFRGNVNSRVYHSPACANYNCKNCTAVFQMQEEAEKAGYRPSGDCLGR